MTWTRFDPEDDTTWPCGDEYVLTHGPFGYGVRCIFDSDNDGQFGGWYYKAEPVPAPTPRG